MAPRSEPLVRLGDEAQRDLIKYSSNEGGGLQLERRWCVHGARASHIKHIKTMSEFVRVKQGSILAGVCSGLEASGKGTAGGWRLLFIIGGFFILIPWVVYPALALIWPEVKTKKEAKAQAGTADFAESPTLAGVEANLSRLVAMKENGLISEDEFAKMRDKELGIS